MRRNYLVGIDEVGRGPLAGPITVAAVAIPRKLKIPITNLPLRDSKRLSEGQRQAWLGYIKQHPRIFYARASVYPKTIDRINVSQAANLAATRALTRLITQNSELRINKRMHVLLDGGLYLNPSEILSSKFLVRPNTVVRADEKYVCVKLASIVAKTCRDRLLSRYHKQYPRYGFDEHKGYGTKRHIAAVKNYGPCGLHRLTFIKNFVKV